MEQIQEPRQRVVAMKPDALANVLRQVERQRPIGPQQAEETLLEPRPPAVMWLEGRQCRRGKGNRRFLGEPDWLVGGTDGLTQSRPLGVEALDPAQGLEEIERPGLAREGVEER